MAVVVQRGAACVAAEEQGASLCLFGHTHVPLLTEADGVTFLNPGAAGASYPAYGLVQTQSDTEGADNFIISPIVEGAVKRLLFRKYFLENLLYNSNLENSSANNILREHKPLIKHIVFNFL